MDPPREANWTFPPGRYPKKEARMKLRHGDKEIEWSPQLDTPRLAAIGVLVQLAPGEAFAIKTIAGEEFTLRYNDVGPLLRQSLNVA